MTRHCVNGSPRSAPSCPPWEHDFPRSPACVVSLFFFSSRRRHTRWPRDWSSDVCSSDLLPRLDKYVDSWRALVKLRDDGVVRSIGVSNFTAAHLDRIIAETDVAPAVNQVELHPYFTQSEQRAADAERTVLTQSWSPLARNAALLTEPSLEEIAGRHGVEVSQVVLRWHVQLGVVPIPKSASPHRQRTNLDVFGFELSESEMRQVSALERGRQSHDPDTHEEF